MSFFSTRGPVDPSSLDRDRYAENPSSPLIEPVEAASSLPRHLLVSLAGISADVTSLQHRCVDAPQLSAAFETILGKLDGLVDSIYGRATDPSPSNLNRPAHTASELSDALANPTVGLPDAGNVVSSQTRGERSRPGSAS